MRRSSTKLPVLKNYYTFKNVFQARYALPTFRSALQPLIVNREVAHQQIVTRAFGSPFKVLYSTAVTKERQNIPVGDCPGCGAPFQTSDPKQPGYYVERKPAKPKSDYLKKSNTKEITNEEYENMLRNDPELQALLNGAEEDESLQCADNTGRDDMQPKENEFENVDTNNFAQGTAESDKVKKADRIICQRCYQLQYHNNPITESTPQFLRQSQQYGSLDFLKTKNSPLIVAVFDITDLPGSLGKLPQLIQKNPSARLILAANKFDILPAKARHHENRIRDWIIQHMKSVGISTKQILSVTMVSAKKGWGISALMRKIDQERRPVDDVYMVGCTNVGKSAIINKFMTQIRGSLDEQGKRLKEDLKAQYKITSSAAPGTTMGRIKIPLYALGMLTPEEIEASRKGNRLVTRNRYLIDTPGLINDQQLFHLLSYEEQKKLAAQREMKPITFRLEPGKSFLLKPLVRIDLIEASNPVLMTLFSPLAPHLTKTEKLPSAYYDQQPAQHPRQLNNESILKTSLLTPLNEIVKVRGVHPSHASVDFSFAGIGWVALSGMFENASFRIWLPKNLKLDEVFTIREPPFLPYEYKGNIRKFFGTGERTKM
ncbi:hypothetical protein BDF20DRAFT_851994 [Mycotypha africana]|uniref:uncharacterized protein n=1 Tax=Mycotypha africana TaxID=64632 RepID=UPI002300137D|nr:uncharacterized protein BDF20DRAFT_851994 [Mycotypha africana]KAI8987745.1 hypothetical protein BDF20DRAFT_851994 [Mycotypha africana]